MLIPDAFNILSEANLKIASLGSDIIDQEGTPKQPVTIRQLVRTRQLFNLLNKFIFLNGGGTAISYTIGEDDAALNRLLLQLKRVAKIASFPIISNPIQTFVSTYQNSGTLIIDSNGNVSGINNITVGGSLSVIQNVTISGSLTLSTPLSLSSGGLGVSLSDPGGNKLLGWDDTDNSISFFTLGVGMSYDHSTHTLSSVPISGLTVNRVPFVSTPTTLTDSANLTWNDTIGALTVNSARIFQVNNTIKDLFIGESAGNTTLTGGGGNIGFGKQTLTGLTTGTENIAIGRLSGAGLSTGGLNVFIGVAAGPISGARSAAGNIVIGYTAGETLTTGGQNIILGYGTSQITTGSSNVLIGQSVQVASATGNGQLSIQNIIYGTGNVNTGNTVSTGAIGIGVQSPTAKLHLTAGTASPGGAPFKIDGGTLLGIAENYAIEATSASLYWTNGSGARTLLSFPTYVATGNALISQGTSTDPVWGKIGLSTHVSGNLPVNNLNNGTGATTNTFWCGNGTWSTIPELYSVGGDSYKVSAFVNNDNYTSATSGRTYGSATFTTSTYSVWKPKIDFVFQVTGDGGGREVISAIIQYSTDNATWTSLGSTTYITSDANAHTLVNVTGVHNSASVSTLYYYQLVTANSSGGNALYSVNFGYTITSIPI